MSKEVEIQKTNYKALIFTGLISLAVAVVGNLLINKFSEETLSLSYEIVASETFGSSNGNIKIATVEIMNQGTKSIDDIVVTINLQEGSIEEYKVKGIPANSYTIDKKENKFILNTKYINPTEQFYIQLLLKNQMNNDFLPSVDLRGRGIIGKQAIKDEKESFLSSISTAMIAIIAFLGFLSVNTIRGRILDSDSLSTIKDVHYDEQRDTFAYVLSINELNDDADEIRLITRKISYWSIADHLTQKWIISGDKDLMTKGCNTLKELIEYAGIQKDSILLIKSNILRLSQSLGNIESEDTILSELKNNNSNVIKKRLQNINYLKNT